MKVNTVIVTYNRKKLLLECIQAIMSQTHKVNKVFIIDNDSNDGTDHLLESEGFLNNEQVIYKKMDKNIGGAGGFHEGIKLSIENSDFVWIMDDDTIPTQNALEELINAQKIINENVSFLASSVYGINNEVMNVPTISLECEKNGYPGWYRYLENGIVKIAYATFVSLLINSDAIKKVGLPCKDYFIWGDDIEYTMRLNKYYGNSYFIGSSKVIHKRESGKVLSIISEENIRRINMFYYSYRNDLINVKEYYGNKILMKLMIGNLRIILKVIFNSKYKYLKIKIILKAIFDFVFKRYNYLEFRKRLDYYKN